MVGDGRGRWGTVGDGGKHVKISEKSGGQWKTARDDRRRQGMVGDGRGWWGMT